MKTPAITPHKIADNDCCGPTDTGIAMNQNFPTSLDRLLNEGMTRIEVLS